MNNVHSIFNWVKDPPTSSILQEYIEVYSVKNFKFKAFKINREILGNSDFDSEFNAYYPLLKSKPGVYFLYNTSLKKHGKTYVKDIDLYIGKADLRIDGKGILSRITEHVKNDGVAKREYHDKWKYALCIVNDTDKVEEEFNPSITKAIESWFIQAFGFISEQKGLKCSITLYNDRSESSGGYYGTDVDQYFIAITYLLSLGNIFGLDDNDVNSMQLSAIETRSASNRELLDDITDSAGEYLENSKTAYDKGFIEEAIANRVISNMFRDTFSRYIESDVITNNGRVLHAQMLTGRKNSSVVITPDSLCKEVIDMLPSDSFSDRKNFLLLYQKDFAFGKAILNRYLDRECNENKSLKKADKLADFIRNRLFVVVPSLECAILNYKSLYEYYTKTMETLDRMWYLDTTKLVLPNIVVMPNYDGIVKSMGPRAQESILRHRFKGGDSEMNFDTVVGNPPYNKDLYIPFVKLGNIISSRYLLMITPAKWQGKADDDNKFIQGEIMSHSDKIVFYQDARELFDIAEIDGISYYLADKANTYEYKTIVNKFRGTETSEYRKICGVLNNNAYRIINKLGNYKSLAVNYRNNPYKLKKEDISKQYIAEGDAGYSDALKVYSSGKVLDERLPLTAVTENRQSIPQYKVVQNEMLGYSFFYEDGKIIGSPDYKILPPGMICTEHYCVYGAFDNLGEAQSMVSYLNTKLIRFLTSTTLTGTTTQKAEFWRFVPDPNVFDHVFTNEELYKRYNLNNEDISLIESVIKERK